MNNEHEQPKSGLAGKVLARIEREGVHPRPRWHFVFSNGFFWTLWGISIAIGAVAVAATIFSLVSVGWQFYAATHETRLEFIVDALPYVWIVLVLLGTVIGYENIRHTKRGYRYPLPAIVGLSVGLSVLLGVVLFLFGVGQLADRGLGRSAPSLSVVTRMEERWVQPEKGLLAGEVTNAEATAFMLRDFRGGEWYISTEDLAERDRMVLRETDRVRVIGTPTEPGGGIFHACLVFPWEIRGQAAGQGERNGDRSQRIRERNTALERIKDCEGVRPYELLRGLRE